MHINKSLNISQLRGVLRCWAPHAFAFVPTFPPQGQCYLHFQCDLHRCIIIWGVPKMVVTLFKMDDLGVPPFKETPIYIYIMNHYDRLGREESIIYNHIVQCNYFSWWMPISNSWHLKPLNIQHNADHHRHQQQQQQRQQRDLQKGRSALVSLWITSTKLDICAKS